MLNNIFKRIKKFFTNIKLGASNISIYPVYGYDVDIPSINDIKKQLDDYWKLSPKERMAKDWENIGNDFRKVLPSSAFNKYPMALEVGPDLHLTYVGKGNVQFTPGEKYQVIGSTFDGTTIWYQIEGDSGDLYDVAMDDPEFLTDMEVRKKKLEELSK